MILLMILCIIIITGFIVILFLSRNRYKDEIKSLNKKEYPLKKIIPIGLFLLERINYRYKSRYDKKMIEKFNTLYDLNKGSKYYRHFLAEKIAFSFLLLVLFSHIALIGGIQDFSEMNKMNNNSFIRTKEDHVESVTMMIDDGNETIEKNIEIFIPKMDESPEEIKSRVDTVAESLEKSLISISQVDTSLNLPESIKGVTIQWDSSPASIMDEKGNVNFDKVPEEGIQITLTAYLSYKDYSKNVSRNMKIIPEKIPPKTMNQIAIELEEAIEDGEYTELGQVTLPSEMPDNNMTIKWEEVNKASGLKVFSFGIVLIFIVFFIRDDDIKRKMVKKEHQIRLHFPDMITKFTLLINAGMTTQSAWNKICSDYQRKKEEEQVIIPLYEEMLTTLSDIKGGLSEYEAYEGLGRRIRVKEVKKLTNILTQTVRKGNADLIHSLLDLSEDAWDSRLVTAKRLGEEASSKLLFPMILLLIIILAVVMAPAFMSLKL